MGGADRKKKATAASADREARLAAALKANLRKRKAQTRARAQEARADADEGRRDG